MFLHSRPGGERTAFILLFLCFFSQFIIAQENGLSVVPVPEALRRPERGEAPRFPEDLVIGELSQGSASTGAYQFAQELLSALAMGIRSAPAVQRSSSLISDSVFEELSSINARSYRIGGGRTEPDGSVSFLVRFIGRTESITGELFVRYETPRAAAATVRAATEDGEENEEDGEESARPVEPVRQEGARWLLDDLILEEKRALADLRDDYRYDFTPYERFF